MPTRRNGRLRRLCAEAALIAQETRRLRARVPMRRVLLVLAVCAEGDGWELGRISLSLAISAMCSEVNTILPLPQQACGKRPAAAPSRSHPSLQRMRAAASAGSKNSKSMSLRSRLVHREFISIHARKDMMSMQTLGDIAQLVRCQALHFSPRAGRTKVALERQPRLSPGFAADRDNQQYVKRVWILGGGL